MDMLRKYILTIISAALISMLFLLLTDKKSTAYTVIKLLCGIFLIITLIMPFNDTNILDLSNIISQSDIDSESYVKGGEYFAHQEKEILIKEKIAAYVLDRAKEMNVDIDVTVELKQDLSSPEVIYIAGSVSPYKKEQLQSIIENDLGVTKEQQIWE